MNAKRRHYMPGHAGVIETLEGRMVLSAISSAGILSGGAVVVATQSVHKAPTSTTLTVVTGTLGQPITFDVTVKASASAGSPTGTVNIIDHGHVIESLPLTPTTTVGKASFSATATLTPEAGGGSYFFGKHAISATFIPSGAFLKSSVNKTFNVSPPAYTTLASGVKVATIASGSGVAIQSGQTATLLYTGYLASNGQIFDDSINDGGTPFRFTLGSGQVIPGFDQGTVGMKVGESRIVLIPPSEGYGDTASGPIPGHSTLIFVMTLESIS